MSPRRPSSATVGAVLGSILLGLAALGCQSMGPSLTPATTGPSPTSVPPAAAYAAIREQVEQIRGLEPTADVEPVTIDSEQLKSNLVAEFDTANGTSKVTTEQDKLIALGLLPPGSSLRTLTLDLEGGQVAGYYSPERNELFVVSRGGTVGPLERSTYAHEFTHQLQDQHFDLDKLGMDDAGQTDRSFARLALVEGDATSAQTTWMQTTLTPQELGQLLGQSLDPEAAAALQRAPAYLRSTSLFGYQDGLFFVSSLVRQGGYAAVDAAFADPPLSTEQVLHPEKYGSHEAPVAVALPAGLATTLGAGWTEAGQDTLGELVLRIWLSEGGLRAPEAATAAAGWGGDRVALFRGPGGVLALAMLTQWDTAKDADEFATAAQTAISGHGLAGRVSHAPGSSTVSVALGDESGSLAERLAG